MITMRSVGAILRQTRESKKLTYAQIAAATKIKAAHLQAIEESNWDSLPPATFTKGLIRNYGLHLGLNGDEMVANFRREYDDRKVGQAITPKLITIPRSFSFTPTTVFRMAIVLIALVLVGYFIHEFQILTGPPPLAVTIPQQNDVITTDAVEVIGKTSPEAALTVNGQQVLVSPTGEFKTIIEMTNTVPIRVVATSKSGKTATIERRVILREE